MITSRNTASFGLKLLKNVPRNLTNPPVNSNYIKANKNIAIKRHVTTNTPINSFYKEFNTEGVKEEIVDFLDAIRIQQLVNAYESNGYLHASLDPLDLPNEAPYVTKGRLEAQNIRPNYKQYGISDKDLKKTINFTIPGVKGFLGGEMKNMTVEQLIQRLDEVYCGNLGVEFLHINNDDKKNWIRHKIETRSKHEYDHDMKCRILNRTLRSVVFEKFCMNKFKTSKRFGADGCETSIVAMKHIVKEATRVGVENVVIAMAHRGRLNVLTNVMHKPLQRIVQEFRNVWPKNKSKGDWGELGDVKYHLGVEYDHYDEEVNRKIHLTLLPNPSHLEAVDPVLIGTSLSKQYYAGDITGEKTLPIMVHGDAALAGQGVVYEVLQMSKLPAYNVGGTIHIVINNQIGFTTNTIDAGSGQHCASIARAIDAPVFHVNADDPEAVTYAADLALQYRQTFKSDVFLNIIGYRRWGHNELDMPHFTQPRMYKKVDEKADVLKIYSNKLMAEDEVKEEYINNIMTESLKYFENEYKAAQNITPKADDIKNIPKEWKNMKEPNDNSPPKITGIKKEVLLEIGKRISTIPDNIQPHPTILKTYKARVNALEKGKDIDFGLAESLAYGTLLSEGFHVRLVGQDAERGTFSHRHATVHDQRGKVVYKPLEQVQGKYKFHNYNSLLSEYAALGVEYGYALDRPETLSIWEAQFGDFCNGAQIIIDQYLTSGEGKWGRQVGLTLLLPHGYDGQGPEHSSSRLERFLQLCDDREDIIHPEGWNPDKRSVIQKHNLQVTFPSTPANHFHCLRRQVIRGFRKPLVILTPKKLLKLRAAVSNLEDFIDNTRFLRYIPGVADNDGDVKRLVLCSGQLYYDLIAFQQKNKIKNVVISRVEQISPFPYDRFLDDFKKYSQLKSVVWCQEEPMNQGAWTYLQPRIHTCLKSVNSDIKSAVYVGRDVASSPSNGDPNVHQIELNNILTEAFDINNLVNSYTNNYL